jgi:CRP/FNR family transcriptional regulator
METLQMRNSCPPIAKAETHSHTAGVRCTGSEVLRWSGLGDLASHATDAIAFPMRRVEAGRTLVIEGQGFKNLYLVGGGSFKCVQTDVDGYEQVLAFAIHGDVIGLDGLGQGCHRSGAVALEDSTVVTLPVEDLLAQGRDLPVMETLLHHAAGIEVARRGDNQYLMAAPSSEVRVARFLLQFANRQEHLGYSGRRLHMVMTRRDIASYLGVAHETVSRVLTALAHEGFIGVSHRDIELRDVAALTELQRVTRGRMGRQRRADIAHCAAVVRPNLTPPRSGRMSFQ